MFTFLLNILQQVGGSLLNPLLDFLTKTVFPFVKKNWKIILPVFLVVGIVGALTWYLIMQNNEIARLKNEQAKNQGLVNVGLNTYEVTASTSAYDKLKDVNKSLQNRINQTNRDVVYFSSLVLEYKTKLDSIRTTAAGTDPNFITNSSAPGAPKDSSDRVFNTFHKGLSISGHYQIHDPYLLFISELKLTSKIDLVVSLDEKTDQYFGTVTTNSEWLRPIDFDVKVIPPSAKFEYFYGLSFNYTTSISGMGFIAGLKRGSWALYGGADFCREANVFKVGIMKFGKL